MYTRSCIPTYLWLLFLYLPISLSIVKVDMGWYWHILCNPLRRDSASSSSLHICNFFLWVWEIWLLLSVIDLLVLSNPRRHEKVVYKSWPVPLCRNQLTNQKAVFVHSSSVFSFAATRAAAALHGCLVSAPCFLYTFLCCWAYTHSVTLTVWQSAVYSGSPGVLVHL